jgi:hypothetical protein
LKKKRRREVRGKVELDGFVKVLVIKKWLR